MAQELPSRPDIEWLKKTAKERLAEMRARDPSAKLYQVQLQIARDYGFQSWRALVAHVETVSLDGEILRAAMSGRAPELAKLLDEHPAKTGIVGASYNRPLLHHAAEAGHAECVRVLLARGFKVDTRDRLDNATALHWAAQAGQLETMRLLLDAGANPNGEGDEHELGAIGWASVLATQPAAVDLLLARGAKPTIFAAVALGRADLVHALAEAAPDIVDRQLSHHERNQTPLHLAVARNQSEIVKLLIELGADVSAKDSGGATPLKYATASTAQSIIDQLIEAGADPSERGNYFEAATPQLDVRSVSAAIDHFTQKLGFEKEWEMGNPPDFACVFRDQVYLFLTSQRQARGTGSVVSIRVRDLDGLHAEYQARGTRIIGPPMNTNWGGRVMAVDGLDGNVLSFWTQVEPAQGLR